MTGCLGLKPSTGIGQPSLPNANTELACNSKTPAADSAKYNILSTTDNEQQMHLIQLGDKAILAQYRTFLPR